MTWVQDEEDAKERSDPARMYRSGEVRAKLQNSFAASAVARELGHLDEKTIARQCLLWRCCLLLTLTIYRLCDCIERFAKLHFISYKVNSCKSMLEQAMSPLTKTGRVGYI